MRKLAVGCVAMAFVAFVAVAGADTVTISATDGTWKDAVDVNGGSTPDISVDGHTVSWGDPATADGPSSYVYAPIAVPYDATTGMLFLLGTFTHNNFPVYPPSLDYVTLDFYLDFLDNGITNPVPPSLSADFNFDHLETTNSGALCPGEAIPCPDVVTLSNVTLNVPFVYNGVNYFFSLLGFSTDGGATTSSQFITQEGLANNAGLYAIITTTPIPEPTALLLLGLGLAGAARRLRRR